MQTSCFLNLEEFGSLVDTGRNTFELESLISKNIEKIKELTDTKFILPISKQIVILLYLSFKYKIPIIKSLALYQLYANDLIVIVLSILDSIMPIDNILKACLPIFEKLKGNLDIEISSENAEFYTLLNKHKFENNLYIPIDLW